MAKKTRLHLKHSKELLEFLQVNKKTFREDKTASGFPTYKLKDKDIYIRERRSGPGAVNRISTFQRQVSKSLLYRYVDKFTKEYIQDESHKIERSLMYKGFCFNPIKEPQIEAAIKIDLDTAYWQTCRYIRMIERNFYRNVIANCSKPTRLRLTGTLGMKVISTDYVDGVKGKRYPREEPKKRYVFHNIYNRVRKFVDELMVWCWRKNPDNFIGFYVDCLWLREYDEEVIAAIQEMFDVKIDSVNIEMLRNDHGKYYINETSRSTGEIVPYDAQFKHNNFVNYKFFHNFTPELKKINFKTQWKDSQMNPANQMPITT